jgi:hypothetical protein
MNIRETAGTDHQILAIRTARARSASASATETNATDASYRLPAGKDAFLAAAEAASDLRIYAISLGPADTTKAPDYRGL